ncbi:DivIVA domain-containing protein [Streptomyces sp. enrichment culture]|uniref:DivIVA domain-containing protein n=1 Tax=Streptomyces sp. enrichment culture TaxID=1795815 RepID=UPI003F563440
MAVAMVVVVAAVTLAVVGGAENEVLPEAPPEHVVDPLPLTRPVTRADVETLRLPLAPRGYRMTDVDDVLDRLAAELAERDARIAELESALAGAQATASGRTDLFAKHPAPEASTAPAPPASAPEVPAPPASAPEVPAAGGTGAYGEGAAYGDTAPRGGRDAYGDRETHGERDVRDQEGDR